MLGREVAVLVAIAVVVSLEGGFGGCDCTRGGALAGSALLNSKASKQVEMYSSSQVARSMLLAVIRDHEWCSPGQRLVGGVGEAENLGRVNRWRCVMTREVKARRTQF